MKRILFQLFALALGCSAVFAQARRPILQGRALTADTAVTVQTRTNTPLYFSVDSNSTYGFRICLYIGSSSTAGIEVALDIPTSATLVATVVGSKAAADSLGTDIMSADTTAGAAFNKYNGTTGVLWIQGTVKTAGTNGNVRLMFLKATSGTATLKSGSFIRAEKY
jgi:hypothetical protein